MPDLPPLPGPPSKSPLRVIDAIIDLINHGDEKGNTVQGVLWKRIIDDTTNEKGVYRVSTAEKTNAIKAFFEVTAAREERMRARGLSKVPAIHQHAHVEQHFAMPKALFDTLTPEQKQLIAENGKEIVVAPPLEPQAVEVPHV